MIKRLFMNQSIRAKIVWSTVLISLVPLLVLSYLFYQNSTRSLEQAMVRSSDQNAEYLSDYLNEYFRSFSTSALQVYGFKRVIDLMEYGTNYNVADIIDVRESLASYYRLAVSNNADIIKIMVYGSDNTLRDSWSRADSYNAIALNQTTPHYGDIVKLPFQHSLMFTYQDPAIKQDLFVYALPIYDPFYREKFGTLLFYCAGQRPGQESRNLQPGPERDRAAKRQGRSLLSDEPELRRRDPAVSASRRAQRQQRTGTPVHGGPGTINQYIPLGPWEHWAEYRISQHRTCP
ncbi:hypothetical protein U9M73_19735 [Paenibacillus phoenicis]|uniref:Uncharacterized protein n=1 Tax=Paenibacillus phoenicis TaxID=554117 RepID=A0ABU5PQC9_9BACL|nr:hypothetical protein [Paenibacillus phoenicis]MEA3572158.1 hypothetical protein [Paenibacillus phoenicis]